MNDGIQFGPRVVPHRYRPGCYLAQFTGAGIGAKFVRDLDGAPRVFHCKESAERAATAALLDALNAAPRAVAGKTFVVRGRRTKAHQALVEEVFRPR